MKKILFIIMLLMLSGWAFADIPAELNAHIKVYLPMEDASSPVLDTMGNVDYSCVNCPNFEEDAVIGHGLQFEGGNFDDLVSDANTVFNRSSLPYTVCFWMAKNNAGVNAYPWGNWITTPYYALQVNDNGRPTAWIAYTSSGSRLVIYGATGDIPNTNFYFYCQSRNGSSGKAWVNATEYSDIYQSAAVPSITEDINHFGTVSGASWSFKIDEFSFFDKALNQAEIEYLYNAGSPGSDQQAPFGAPVVPPNYTIIYWNVTNHTVYNISNFTGQTSVTYNSSNESTLYLLFYENSTKIYGFTANNNTIYSINLTNLTYNATSFYHWRGNANHTANYTLTYLNISDYSLPPPPKIQYTYSNIANGTTINLSAGASAFKYAMYSWNYTNYLTKVYLNGTEQCSFNLANITYRNCDISNLTGVNGTYYAIINNTFNESRYYFRITNISGVPFTPGEKIDYYMAIALICVALLSFLIILSFRIDTNKLDKEFFLSIPMFKYFILVVTGWFVLGVFDIVIGIVETESITRLAGVTSAIYSGFMYVLWAVTVIWFIALLYLILMHYQSWLSK